MHRRRRIDRMQQPYRIDPLELAWQALVSSRRQQTVTEGTEGIGFGDDWDEHDSY
jgi:hypothetical protein